MPRRCIDIRDLPPAVRGRLGVVAAPRRSAREGAAAIQSLSACRPEVLAHEAHRLVVRFPGARLLSLNALYRMHYHERGRYAKAWHRIWRQAAMAIPPASRRLEGETFRIRVVRYSRRPLDIDNIIAKPAVDGLRHAGFIADDNPGIVVSVTTDNAHGDYAVEMWVERSE